MDIFSSLYSFLKKLKSLNFFVGLAGVGFLSFFGCVCVWDNHLEKVHLLEMDALEKTQLIEMELLDKKKAVEMELLEEAQENAQINAQVQYIIYCVLAGIAGLVTIGILSTVYSSDSNVVNEELIRELHVSNFSKIEVMQKQVEIMFPKIIKIETKVFDLFCNMDHSGANEMGKLKENRGPITQRPWRPSSDFADATKAVEDIEALSKNTRKDG